MERTGRKVITSSRFVASCHDFRKKIFAASCDIASLVKSLVSNLSLMKRVLKCERGLQRCRNNTKGEDGLWSTIHVVVEMVRVISIWSNLFGVGIHFVTKCTALFARPQKREFFFDSPPEKSCLKVSENCFFLKVHIQSLVVKI